MSWSSHTKAWSSQTVVWYQGPTWTVWPEITWKRVSNSMVEYTVNLYISSTGYISTDAKLYVDGIVKDSKSSIGAGKTTLTSSVQQLNCDAGTSTHTFRVSGAYTDDSWYCTIDFETGEYTVSYNANGGSGEPANQTKVHGTDLRLSYTQPTRTGHSFLGWATSASGGVQYSPGSLYKSNAPITLYAQWEPNKYTITYHANGGDSSSLPAQQTKTYGNNVVLSSTIPTRTGYSFVKWNTSSGGGGTSYSPGGTYSTNASVTLYAIWTPIIYTISYNANGGYNAPNSQTKTYGVNLTLTTAVPTRTGYTFKGWATSASSTTVAYNPGSVYTANASATLYAVWQIITYRVQYNANGGSGIPSEQTKIYGQTLYLSNTKPTRQNYNFVGWNTKSDGTGTTYAAGGAYTANAAVTLYAKWEIIQYNIYYYANGGYGAPSTQTAGIGTTIALSNTRPSKSTETNSYTVTYDKVKEESTISKNSDTVSVSTIYTFSRWNTRADGTGTDYYPGQSFKVPGQNTYLYAIYTFTLSGSVALPTGTLTQWKIAFWATSLTDPELNQVGDPYTPNKNITLYAIWAPVGTGGYLKIPSETGLTGVGEGSRLYITGFHNPENDGPKTVVSYSFANGYIELNFEEDFSFAGQQDASLEGLHIYGTGNIVPDFDYICALNNRLWGCNSKTRTIYGSALGDPTDFWTFAGDALDAYQVAVGSGGDFTGAVALNNNVLFLKQHTIHKIIGSYPAEYMLYTYDIDGTSASNGLSAVNCDGTIIFVTEHGIGTYTGSSAGQLSKELGEGNMNNAIAMYNGEQYFLHYTDNDGNRHTYIYDVRYGLWVEEKYEEVMAFAHMGDADYALIRSTETPGLSIYDQDGNELWGNLSSNDNMQIYADDDLLWDSDEDMDDLIITDTDDAQLWPVDLPYGDVYRIDSSEDYDDDWEIVFKPFYEDIYSSRGSRSHILEKKRYTGITFRIELPKNSWIKAELKSDDGRWIPVARKAGTQDKVLDFVIRTPRCDKVQLRLSGHGPMTILSMEREYTIGSRR